MKTKNLIFKTNWIIKNYSQIYALILSYERKPKQLTVSRQNGFFFAINRQRPAPWAPL